MIDVLQREFVYVGYYFTVQFRQIFRYWLLGMLIGSAVAVFGTQKIHGAFSRLLGRKFGLLGIVPACLLGIASAFCCRRSSSATCRPAPSRNSSEGTKASAC
ncbi:MAG: hypothetical protein SOV63_10345 [Pyramidobacter porci]|uniref:hypothetical protein n=1 Tax=Pyramidobacter porci TaxID=2605789 RepID=UPI002A765390|nr:hypothetical protein [Pyramidobacter porci]MCI6260434.1 hypothetical protein [Pyramidobacter sp.]MDY2649189.1 hypothetical protein [Pyramidobacter porci]